MFSALAAVGAAAVISHGAFHRNSPVFGRVLSRLPRGSARDIALTFDDGPNPAATPMILETLAREGVRATFAGLMGLKDPGQVARFRGKEESDLVGA